MKRQYSADMRLIRHYIATINCGFETDPIRNRYARNYWEEEATSTPRTSGVNIPVRRVKR